MSLTAAIKKKLSKGRTLDISFTCEDNEPFALLGSSGSGKSVTLKCIAGIETPDSGSISLGGRALFDNKKCVNLKPQERRVGYLFQNYALFPTMSVMDNITAALNGTRGEKRAVARAYIDRFGLAGLEESLPAKLSGGEQQRAALARLLAAKPEAVLLDEPFSALDTKLRASMTDFFTNLLADDSEGIFRNMIIVTHDPDEARRFCRHIFSLD